MNYFKITTGTIGMLLIGLLSIGCKKSSQSPGGINNSSIANIWLTTSDQTQLLAKQSPLKFSAGTGTGANTISVDESQVFQGIDGYGFMLTDGSAIMLDSLNSGQQNSLLRELFSNDDNAIGISYIRIGIGATTLSTSNYTYDDIPSGTDVDMKFFSLNPSQKDLIPILKKIVAINPNIKILASPWSPPLWMKTNHSFKAGTLNAVGFQGLANYLVKYVQAMKEEGINITAITPQNEPNEGAEDPSMLFAASDEANFIANNLGPAFKAAGLTTQIICFDHNASTPYYPQTVLGNSAAYPYITGSAFHLYSGDFTALSTVHDAFPNKKIYFTEQYTSSNGTFAGYLKSATYNLIIGTTRNWSRNVIEWNLAADVNNGPHKADGCPDCLPAVTISASIKRNISYYLIAHASKFVQPGANRIGSNIAGDIQNVAFKNPDGSKVIIVLNRGTASETFNVVFQNRSLTYTIPQGAVATIKW